MYGTHRTDYSDVQTNMSMRLCVLEFSLNDIFSLSLSPSLSVYISIYIYIYIYLVYLIQTVYLHMPA